MHNNGRENETGKALPYLLLLLLAYLYKETLICMPDLTLMFVMTTRNMHVGRHMRNAGRLDVGWKADFVWDYGTPRRGLVREHLIMSYVLYRILATQNLSIPRVFTAHMFFIKIPAV